MKISSIWKLRSIAGKITMGLALAAMIGSIDVVPALGYDHDREGRHGRYEHRGRWHDHYRYEHRGRWHDHYRYEHNRRYYRPYYGYREGYYSPPPVIYAPPPQPGIGIFFPIHR